MDKDDEVRCPNCSVMHEYNKNGYCSECEEKFGWRGMYTHIDRDGVLSNGEESD